MRLVLFAVSTSTTPTQVWPMLAANQEAGAQHKIEKSNSFVSSPSRDTVCAVTRCPDSSGNQLWRGTIHRCGPSVQATSARVGTGICNCVCSGSESGSASNSPISYAVFCLKKKNTYRQKFAVSI